MNEAARVRALKKFSIDAANTPGEIRLLVDQTGEAAAGILFEDVEGINHPTARCFHFFITHRFWRHATMDDLAELIRLPEGCVVAYGVQEWDPEGKKPRKPGIVRLSKLLGFHNQLCKEGLLIYYTRNQIPAILIEWVGRHERFTCADYAQSPLAESPGSEAERSEPCRPGDPR